MSEVKTYTGSCHCGAIKYNVALASVDSAMACNCSICSRMGWRLAFVPATEFNLLQGEEALVDYQFGHKRAHHYFCGACGVRPFGRGTMGDGAETVMINLRCVEGVDAETLEVHWYDGASR